MASTTNPVHKLFNVDASYQGEAQWKSNSDVNLEVINLGISRTGTSSLRVALATLGFGPVYHQIENIRDPARAIKTTALLKYLNEHPEEQKKTTDATIKRIHSLMQGYKSTVDAPMCDLIPELVAAYPNAKFILSVRDSQEVWWKSWARYAKFFCFQDSWYYKIYHVLVLPVFFVKTMNNLIVQTNIRLLKDFGSWTPEIYRIRNKRIHDTVPKGQLLEYNCKQGWEPLCKFLNVPVPNEPFPKVNEGNSLMGFIVGSQVYGATLWAMWFGVAVAAVYFARDPAGSIEVAKSFAQRGIDMVGSLFSSGR